MDNEVELSAQAFSKMLMHAMKYPHSPCSGLLLSPKPTDDEEENEENGDEQSRTRIIDAIPISHASHWSAPNVANIEVALNSVSIFAQEQELVISGYYQTESYPDSLTTNMFTHRVMERICESFPNAVLCQVIFEQSFPLSLLQLIDGKWRRKPPSSLKFETDPKIIEENILYSKEKLYRKIVDFDEFFNNISLDWTNATIGQKIDFLIANVC